MLIQLQILRNYLKWNWHRHTFFITIRYYITKFSLYWWKFKSSAHVTGQGILTVGKHKWGGVPIPFSAILLGGGGGGQSTVSCSNKRLYCSSLLSVSSCFCNICPFTLMSQVSSYTNISQTYKAVIAIANQPFCELSWPTFFPIMGNSAIDSLPGKTSEKRCSIFNGAFCTRCSRVKSQAFSCFKEDIIYGKKEEQNLRCFLLPLWLEPFTFWWHPLLLFHRFHFTFI